VNFTESAIILAFIFMLWAIWIMKPKRCKFCGEPGTLQDPLHTFNGGPAHNQCVSDYIHKA
jgi:hypothetical protein